MYKKILTKSLQKQEVFKFLISHYLRMQLHIPKIHKNLFFSVIIENKIHKKIQNTKRYLKTLQKLGFWRVFRWFYFIAQISFSILLIFS